VAGVLVLLALALSGCATEVLARKMVQAPNRNGAPRIATDPKAPFAKTYSHAFRVHVGPPAAELSVAVLEPGDYNLKYDLELKKAPGGGGTANYKINWSFPAPDAPRLRPKATVFLLHGILVSKEYMIHWALFLAQKGYRTVIVDLRGHGQSTGEWITFGAVERTDMKQVLDELGRRGLADGPVGVLGVSYGAAVGIDWAAIDPRVGSVVALEPFSDPRKAIVEFSRGYAPQQVKGISDAQFAVAEVRAAHIAGFSWDDADVLRSIARLRVPVLLFHGADDTWISPSHSQRLLASAPAGSRLEMEKGDNHLTLSIRLGPMADEADAWFDSHLGQPPARINSLDRAP
jgi:pimeloyl-ACP methyl ester carboxylesterase